jgi:hypothetical protein
VFLAATHAATHGNRPLFDVLVGLHVASAVVGFGAVLLHGIYGGMAATPERAGATEESNRYFKTGGWVEWVLLAVPFLGAAALAVRPGGSEFGDLWVISALVVWLVAAVVLIRVVHPAEQVLRGRSGASDAPSVAAGRRLKWGALVCDALFLVALLLMVSQPT